LELLEAIREENAILWEGGISLIAIDLSFHHAAKCTV
jgi:hypothetical protein